MKILVQNFDDAGYIVDVNFVFKMRKIATFYSMFLIFCLLEAKWDKGQLEFTFSVQYEIAVNNGSIPFTVHNSVKTHFE